MIKKFELGKYYMYTGTEREYGWNGAGYMDFALTGEPFLCVSVVNYPNQAGFETTDSYSGHLWNWSDGFRHWIEVPTKGYDETMIGIRIRRELNG